MHDGPKSSFGVLGRRLKNLIVAEELSQSLPALQRCMFTISTLTQSGVFEGVQSIQAFVGILWLHDTLHGFRSGSHIQGKQSNHIQLKRSSMYSLDTNKDVKYLVRGMFT